MRFDLIKKYIDVQRFSTKDEVLEYLKKDTILSSDEKNIVYLWQFPLLLGDRELPSKIQEVSGPDKEMVILIGAYRSVQYGRFIRHLLHAFTDPTLVFPVSGKETDDCCICGKQLKCFESEHTKENLAYSSKESSVSLCMNCLVHLNMLDAALQTIEGSDYLNRYKK